MTWTQPSPVFAKLPLLLFISDWLSDNDVRTTTKSEHLFKSEIHIHLFDFLFLPRAIFSSVNVLLRDGSRVGPWVLWWRWCQQAGCSPGHLWLPYSSALLSEKKKKIFGLSSNNKPKNSTWSFLNLSGWKLLWIVSEHFYNPLHKWFLSLVLVLRNGSSCLSKSMLSLNNSFYVWLRKERPVYDTGGR